MSSKTDLLARVGASRLGALVHRKRLAVIGYHGVPDRRAFARHLDVFERYGTFIGPDDLSAALDGSLLPPLPILLTFDDGDPSIFENALPEVSARGLQPLLFVISGLLDTDQPSWWSEVLELTRDPHEVSRLKSVPDEDRLDRIEELRRTAAAPARARQLTTAEVSDLEAAGFSIGNHTFLHPCLDRCEADVAIDQVRRGHEALIKRGITPTWFAYPNGNLDPRVEPTLRTLGYHGAFIYDDRHACPTTDPLRLSRLQLQATASPERAALVVSGIHGAIARRRRSSGG